MFYYIMTMIMIMIICFKSSNIINNINLPCISHPHQDPTIHTVNLQSTYSVCEQKKK